MNQSATNAISEVFPYLIVRNAAAAVEFYQKAFGATEMFRLEEPSGRIGHVQLKFGDSVIMFADEFPEHNILSPLAYGGTGVRIHLHVADVDRMTQQCVEAGATVLMPPTTQFYGERTSRIQDPFGHHWLLGSQVENVSTREMQERYTQMLSKP